MAIIKGIELIKNGKRLDGRKPMELREMEMKVGVVPNANGSAMVRFGKTTAIAAVYGPRLALPKHLQSANKAIVQCRYNMAPFSVDERVRPGSSRREVEISKVVRLALEPVLFLENYPKTTIDIYIEIIEADGSTRVTSINAASLALADAGVPMKDLVVAVSGGKINGKLIIDLNGIEDNNSEADIPMAFIPGKKEITLLQMDGELKHEEIKEIMNNIFKAGEEIYKMQVKVLKDKYRVIV